jgi:sugar (pentulose or hexulose) kinase
VDCLIALDAGTGSGRCLAFDARGRVLAVAQEPVRYRMFVHPEISMIRGFDLDADAFWGVLARSTRKVMAALPPGTKPCGVIGTSQREGCVFLGHDDELLYAGPNLDARAAMEGMEVEAEIGAERLHAITGHAPPYIFALSRLLWFRKNDPTARLGRLLMLNDWITWRLSGEQVAEHSNASESMLYDVSRRAWSDDLLHTFSIPHHVLAPLVDAGSRVGTVTAAAAADTGLPEGLPVFAGGADTESALVGSGAIAPGETCAVLGTTTPVQHVTTEPILDPEGNLWTSPHVTGGHWVLESNAGDTGGAYRWLVDLVLGSADEAAHGRAEALAAERPPGPGGVLSVLGPAIFNLRSMNPFRPAAVLFRYPLLHVDRPDRGELLRGFLENVAFAVRGNCEQIAAVSGAPIERLRVSGGMTRSPTLLGLIATVLGVPLDVADVSETASLGSAVLAAVGCGLYADVPGAVAAMTSTHRVDPDVGRIDEFGRAYAKWRETYEALQPWTVGV